MVNSCLYSKADDLELFSGFATFFLEQSARAASGLDWPKQESSVQFVRVVYSQLLGSYSTQKVKIIAQMVSLLTTIPFVCVYMTVKSQKHS